MIKTIYTNIAPGPTPTYTQAKIAGGFLFASGQIAINPASGAVEADTIEGQTEQIMKNIAAILAEAGLTFDNVVKTTCFLKNMSDFGTFNEIYGQYFTSKPARSCVAAAQLPKDVLAEVEIIAVCG